MKLVNVKYRRARDSDLDKLLPWLEADHLDFGDGFWPNRQMISQAAGEGDLYVATHRGKVVGFQVGETQIDLIQVQRRHQRKGVGSFLIDRVLQRVAEAGKTYCFAGALDEGFWLKLGFMEFVGDPRGGRVLMAFPVPTCPRQAVVGGSQGEPIDSR